ncbi:MAG: hypothetical protein AAF773_02365 [Cyanobacteria bacterium P01_D01_bin.115]
MLRHLSGGLALGRSRMGGAANCLTIALDRRDSKLLTLWDQAVRSDSRLGIALLHHICA